MQICMGEKEEVDTDSTKEPSIYFAANMYQNHHHDNLAWVFTWLCAVSWAYSFSVACADCTEPVVLLSKHWLGPSRPDGTDTASSFKASYNIYLFGTPIEIYITCTHLHGNGKMTFFFDLLCSQFFATLPYPTTPVTCHTIIITGANSGLSFEAANHCVRIEDNRLVLGVQDIFKGISTKSALEIVHAARKCVIDVWELNLLSPVSIKAFAMKSMDLNRLGAVLEHAGMTTMTWRLSQGIETTMMTNVFGTELLALLLLPKLRETALLFNVQPKAERWD
ncbi:hypothetical protein B0J11DRAFT_507887 [Dendryphion nanum]|uniref:Uncharacterized protein n=1 Tax=Dendryphion nanum TaxID=256645 RepID=A0A9P9DL04_9PLEO|nr:hypothetical protein B0J11DRAFT_507887 [Dendryphion nanum]